MEKRGIYIAGMGLANILTFGRVIIVPLIVLCFFMPPVTGSIIALALFLIAAVSDYFDGVLARRWGQSTLLGKMLDPIADKVLIGVVLLMLVFDKTIDGWHIWAAAIILFREILISGMREFLAGLGVTIHVTKVAKWKTTIQMVALAVLLAAPAGEVVFAYTLELGLVILWLAAALTFYTGYDYLKGAMPTLQDK